MIGIYKITNKENGKCYIGQSNNITRRWHEHVKALENHNHHSWKLQQAYDEFGVTSFTFEILELCDVDELDLLEEKYIEVFNSLFSGYNVMGENGVLNLSQIMKDNGRYIIDIEKLFADVKDYSLIIRFIMLYVSVVGVDNKINERLVLKRKSSLKEYLNLSEREASRTINELVENNLLISDMSDLGFRFNNGYIKKVYSIKKKDSGLFVLYKHKFQAIYQSVAANEHKQLGYLLKLSTLFNNSLSKALRKEIKRFAADNNICDTSNFDRFFKKLLSLNTPFGNVIGTEHDYVVLNPAFYQPCVSLENKSIIDDIFTITKMDSVKLK